MKREVVWARPALRDLQEIYRHIAQDDLREAERFGHHLIETSQTLEEFSERGRAVPDLDADLGLRELIVGQYRMVYRVRSHSVRILRILHSRRDFPRAWKQK